MAFLLMTSVFVRDFCSRREDTRKISVLTSCRYQQELHGLAEASPQCHLMSGYKGLISFEMTILSVYYEDKRNNIWKTHRHKQFPIIQSEREENYLGEIQKLNLHIIFSFNTITLADHETIRHKGSSDILKVTRKILTVITEILLELFLEYDIMVLWFFLLIIFFFNHFSNTSKEDMIHLFTTLLTIKFKSRDRARITAARNIAMKFRKDKLFERDIRRLSEPKYLQTSPTFQPDCTEMAADQLNSSVINTGLHSQPSSTSELTEDLKWLLHPRPRTNQTVRLYPVTFLPPSGSSSLPKEAMSYKGSRLASLASLPASCDVSRVRLAEAGFYYDRDSQAQRNDSSRHELVCYSCGLAYGGWLPGDHPTQVHQRLKPDCPHLRSLLRPAAAELTCLEGPVPGLQNGAGRSAQAVASPAPQASLGPLSLSSSSSSSTSSVWDNTAWLTHGQAARPMSDGDSKAVVVQTFHRSRDLATDCLAIVPDLAPPSSRPATESLTRHGSAPRSSSRDSLSPASSADPPAASRSRELREDLEDRPPLAMGSAVYPQYCLQQERLATFRLWPLTHLFRPDDLVLHGFYYAGYADCIRCFYCGVGLKSWNETDDVMKEHIRWRPSCGYILSTRGRRFVGNVLEMLRLETDTQTSAAAGTSSDPARTPQRPTGDPGLGRTQPDQAAPTAPLGSPQQSSSAADLSAHGAQAPQRLGEAQTPRDNASPDQARSDLVYVVEGLGFNRDVIDRAVRHLQQLELSIERPEELIEAILSMGLNDSGDVSTTTDDSGNLNSVQTDAESCPPQETSLGQSELVQQMMQENERLRSLQTCKICRAAKVGMIFMPCGHVTACAQCGAKIRHCNLCGHFIRATANIYLS